MGKTYWGTREVLNYIKEHEIQFLDLKFVDLFGNLQHLTLPTEKVDSNTFEKGLTFDGSSVKGFQRIHESDMLLKPDPESMFKDPFFDAPSVSVFCEIIDPRGYRDYIKDPRAIARKTEILLQSKGIAEKAFLGPELEFFIFDDVRFNQSTNEGYYFLNSEAAFWSTGKEGGRNLGHRAGRKQGYFAAPPVDQYSNLRSKISQTLDHIGLQPELHHHEVGAAGQSEIGFKFGTLLRQADNAIKYKYAVKNVVERYEKTATFMPKPLLQENGSGMHVNISLMKNGKNIFHQEGNYGDLSDLALHFIAGILKHAKALCAICNPTTNSYRRLVPGYEAPMNLVYSQRNRSACIRIPLATSPAAKRVEFRTPDPSSNPYLAFSAIVLAGIDGVQNKITPPAPVDSDIYEYAATKSGASMERTPGSLGEAIKHLEEDHDFLVKDNVFTTDLIETWIEYKRKEEIEYVDLRPHPAEFILYYNI